MQSGQTPQVEDQFSGLKVPDASDMSLQLEQLVQQGVITPEQAQSAQAGQSDLNNISTDPSLKKAQMDALSGLQDVSKNGLTAQDQSNLNKIRTQEETQSRGARDAILQNAQSRGLGGSGLELMSQMQNQQDSATRGSQRDMDIAGQAQDRALQALIAGGNMGGQIQAQDFGQKAQVAGANDAISRFNAQNQQQTNLANTQANNAAQAANLATKQGVADSNVNNQNAQQQYNKQLIQQNFNNEMARRGGQAQVAQQNAMIQGQNSQNRANAQNQTIGIGAGLVSGGLTSVAQAGAKKQQEDGMKTGGLVEGEALPYDSEPRILQAGEFVIRKEDVPEMLKNAHTDKHGKFDAAAFLDSVTGHRYGYGKKGKA